MSRSTDSVSTSNKCRANFTPLTPISFLPRAAEIYPERAALIHGSRTATWRETYQRCLKLSSALRRRGIGRGDIIAVMAPNIPALYEAHFGVPMAGGVLNALNTRLKSQEVAFQLAHSGARMVLVDHEFGDTMRTAVAMLQDPPLIVGIDDDLYAGSPGPRTSELSYEALLEEGSADDG